ncbi:MAG: hypothetical protein GYB31_10320 [Bacteroidetes bacterium]|nr:hypothetical protein [Bacteroidota bacterium]
MKKILPIILVLAGIALIAYGFITWQDSKAVLEIGELEVSASDQSGTNKGLIFLAIGVISAIAGLYTWKK